MALILERDLHEEIRREVKGEVIGGTLLKAFELTNSDHNGETVHKTHYDWDRDEANKLC